MFFPAWPATSYLGLIWPATQKSLPTPDLSDVRAKLNAQPTAERMAILSKLDYDNHIGKNAVPHRYYLSHLAKFSAVNVSDIFDQCKLLLTLRLHGVVRRAYH